MTVNQRTMRLSVAAIVISLALITVNDAYALNYEPIEFITNADDVTFGFPFALASDGTHLIVSDTTNEKIYVLQKVDSSWHVMGSFDRRSAVDMSFDRYGRLAVLTHVHPEGAIYLYNLTYNTDGTLANADIVHEIQGVTPNRTLFMFPHGLTTTTIDGHDLIIIGGGSGLDRKIQVYEVTDTGISLAFAFNNADIYDANGNDIGNVTNGYSINPWPSILDVKMSGDGKVMVAYKTGFIAIYNIDYNSRSVERIVSIGEAGSELGQFNEPRGILHDTNNNYLIVSDNLNNRLQVFDYSTLSDGINTPIFYYGSGIAGNGERELNTPRKIIMEDDKVYLADASNARIVVLTLNDTIPNDYDQPDIDPIEDREWYRFSAHREMFQTISRIIYTKLIEEGIDDYTATKTALNIPSKALEVVLTILRSLPNDARLNIPWSSSLKGDLVIDSNIVYNAACVIGKPGSTGISDPAEYHNPPPQIGDTLYCAPLAIPLADSGETIEGHIRSYFIDPDGVIREVYYYDNTGRHEGRNNDISTTEFYFDPFAIDLDKNGEWRLVNIFTNDGNEIRVEILIHVGSSYEFNDLSTLEYALLNSGISEEDAINTVNVIEDYIEENSIALPDDGVLIVNATEGSVYGLACILPHTPPLSIGEQVDCIVFFLANPSESITIDDLHLYQVVNGISTPIQDWYWSSSIPNPFIWIETITMNEAGDWSINADFTEHGSVSISTIVSFNVVSETVIGAIALIGTALSILAYKRR
ncbi:MAG: hypothetical protein QW416_02890 [Candidatus Nitrosocaldaceae archaeon]